MSLCKHEQILVFADQKIRWCRDCGALRQKPPNLDGWIVWEKIAWELPSREQQLTRERSPNARCETCADPVFCSSCALDEAGVIKDETHHCDARTAAACADAFLKATAVYRFQELPDRSLRPVEANYMERQPACTDAMQWTLVEVASARERLGDKIHLQSEDGRFEFRQRRIDDRWFVSVSAPGIFAVVATGATADDGWQELCQSCVSYLRARAWKASPR